MKFLLVDDQEEITLLMEKILTPHGTCVVAMDGETAVQYFEDAVETDESFDAVFLDIQMPGMDGHEVADRLRQVEAKLSDAAQFKLFMLTALTDSKSVSKSLFRGGKADAYISKPIKKEKILSELRLLKLI